ncbi:hypothetical protein ACO1O0_000148 [Amphichorda felina]
MQHQHSPPVGDGNYDAPASHQSLINAVAHIMRLTGLEADSVTERLRAAMGSIHADDASNADKTPGSQLQPDRQNPGLSGFGTPENVYEWEQGVEWCLYNGIIGWIFVLWVINSRNQFGSASPMGKTMPSQLSQEWNSGIPDTSISHGHSHLQPFSSSHAASAPKISSFLSGTHTGLGINGHPGLESQGTFRVPPGLPISALESNYTSNTNSLHQGFRPMQAVLDPSSRHHNTHTRSLHTLTNPIPPPPLLPPLPPYAPNFSSKYYGMHTSGNASADHLPAEQNCALWLRNLPPDVTYRELLSSIRGVGRIWCTFINTPDFVSHSTAAAKVVFFAPESARLFLQHVDNNAVATGSSRPPLSIRGFRIRADHNRIKYARHAAAGGASRVLIVTGEAWFVNEASLAAWFSERFIFQVDEVVELVRAGGRAVVEFRFGSYRCQAQMGKMSLERIRPAGFEKAEFGDDPCEKGESLVSYRIAAERIQGEGI